MSISGTGSVSPSSVLFVNNTKNYTLTGTSVYGIVGAATVTLSGSGAVTIANSNAYYGGTTVNAGSLNATGTSALGTGPLCKTAERSP